MRSQSNVSWFIWMSYNHVISDICQLHPFPCKVIICFFSRFKNLFFFAADLLRFIRHSTKWNICAPEVFTEISYKLQHHLFSKYSATTQKKRIQKNKLHDKVQLYIDAYNKQLHGNIVRTIFHFDDGKKCV